MLRHGILRNVRNVPTKRVYSQKPQVGKTTSTSTSPSGTVQTSRIDRIISRTPKFLHRHLQSLRTAPVTHISAFLLLHELTAVIPLFGLAGAFHYYNWLPPYFAEGAWVVAGVEKFGRYARRKGWISSSEEQEAEREVKSGELGSGDQSTKPGQTGKWFNRGEGGVRWVVEFATAYAIVKAFLIPRLIVSAWAAPSFARWTIIPVLNGLKRWRRSAG